MKTIELYFQISSSSFIKNNEKLRKQENVRYEILLVKLNLQNVFQN